MLNLKEVLYVFSIPSPVSRLLTPFIALIFCVFISGNSFTQPQYLTYEDAIRIALENNITIKQQQNNLKLSQAEKRQSTTNFLPGVGANGRGYRTDGRQWSNEESAMVNTTINRASYSIGSNLTVFNGFKNINRLKKYNQLLEAQKEKVEQSKQDIIYLVSQQFLQILLDQEFVLIAEKDFEVQKKLYERIEAFVKGGIRTKTELLLQEAQLKTSEINIFSSQNQLRLDKATLAKTLHLEPNKEFEILNPSWNVDSILNTQYNLDSLIQSAKKNRSDIKRLNAEEKALLQGIRVSQSDYLPTISIYYNYGSDYASNNRRLNPVDSLYHKIAIEDQLLKENYSHQYGFNISIPIFNRLQTRTNVIRSKIAHENSKLAYQDFEMQLFLDVQNAYHDFLSYKEIYLSNIIRADASQKAYQKQFELYLLGQGSLVDLNVENQHNIKAQSEKIQAEYMLLFQQFILNYYIGI